MIRLAFYRGTSLVSKLIRWQTRGRYSHVGVILQDGGIIEAWQNGGVRYNATIGMVHDPATPVDLYSIPTLTRAQNADILQWLKQQCGLGYDFRGVFRFLTRTGAPIDRKRWFCSELVAAAFGRHGITLINTNPAKVSPEVLSWSPFLKFEFETHT